MQEEVKTEVKAIQSMSVLMKAKSLRVDLAPGVTGKGAATPGMGGGSSDSGAVSKKLQMQLRALAAKHERASRDLRTKSLLVESLQAELALAREAAARAAVGDALAAVRPQVQPPADQGRPALHAAAESAAGRRPRDLSDRH